MSDRDALLTVMGFAASHHVFSWVAQKLGGVRKQLVGRVAKLVVYPVKSGGGVEVDSADCAWLCMESQGFRDRFWMATTESGVPLAQTQIPKLALIRPTFQNDKLLLDAPEMRTLCVPRDMDVTSPTLKTFKFLRSKTGEGADCGDDAAKWLSEFLGKGARLVHAVSGAKNVTYRDDTMYGPLYREHDQGFYQFSAPYMLMSRASVDDLNTRLKNQVDYRPFRPSILVEGCEAYEEDNWERIFIGEATFYRIKLCTRCPIVNTEPETGTRNADNEPLNTLKSYRLFGSLGYKKNDPALGLHLGVDECGPIKVGDPVYAIRREPEYVKLIGV